MAADEKMNQHLGQAVRVVMQGDADLGKVALLGHGNPRSVEQSKALFGQAKVVRRRAALGTGIGPGTNEARLAQLLQSALDHTAAGESLVLERLAEAKKLLDSQRRAIERGQDFDVTGRNLPMREIACHRRKPSLPSPPFVWLPSRFDMAGRKFINVDELVPQIEVEQAARYYGCTMGEVKRAGDEIRTKCFLNCGKDHETGHRALAIKADEPKKPFYCHEYGCGKKGNLVGLCDLMKPGENAGGRPRGDRFKAIARDLLALANGASPLPQAAASQAGTKPESEAARADATKPQINVPLKESDKASVRALVHLDQKLIVDVEQMHPAAAAYVRARPYLTPELMRDWRIGYLPRDAGEDKAGGTLRGTFVYPVLDEAGEPLAWFGRNLNYEKERQAWIRANREGREPAKFRFPKTFHRGRELFGQDRVRDIAAESRDRVTALGLLVVEGANDAIRMAPLQERAVGLLSNQITEAQAEKIAYLAWELAGGNATLLLDNDEEGERGARQAAVELARRCRVRLGWHRDGPYKDRQPESLSHAEWGEIAGSLLSRG